MSESRDAYVRSLQCELAELNECYGQVKASLVSSESENAKLRAECGELREKRPRSDYIGVIHKQRDVIEALQLALRDIKFDLENCDWTCERCGYDYLMTETDIYLRVSEALSQQKDCPYCKGTALNPEKGE